MDQHWIFDLAEQNPERLLSLSEEEFETAMADAGFDVVELFEDFQAAVAELVSNLHRGESS